MKQILKQLLHHNQKQKLCAFFLCILTLSCCGCAKKALPISKTGFYFDTVITITLYENEKVRAKDCDALLDSCFSLCETYEAMLSRTKEGSDIWRINHAGTAPTRVHSETIFLLEKALRCGRATDGMLDITIAPVTDLWDFSSEHILALQEEASPQGGVPDASLLAKRLSHVNYRNVLTDGTSVVLKDADAALDLGCIAKGYIADRLKEHLQKSGITSALINLGGNIQTIGSKPDGSPFQLGIQKPFGDAASPAAILSVSDLSLVSSGVYERYFEADGIRYHHLLNPKTGMPENNGLLSVSILTASSADADLLSTAAFLLGLPKGMAYIESLPDTEGIFLTEDGALHPTSGLDTILQIP